MNSPYDHPEVPWSNEAEQGVLGGLMLDISALDSTGGLDASDFYSGAHQEIYRHIRRLYAEGKGVDVLSLHESLKDAGRDEFVGGLAYVGDLAMGSAGSSGVSRHAAIVREKAMLRRLLAAGAEIQALTVSRDGMSASDKVQRAQAIVMDLAEQNGSDRAPRLAADVLPLWLERFAARQGRADGDVVGIPTGIVSIDKAYGGLEGGRLYVIAGRPGMGKSTLTSNFAEYAAISEGKRVLICSQEMPGVEVLQNLIASVGRIDKQRLRDARLTDDEYDALTAATTNIKRAPLMLDEQGALTLEGVQTKVRQAQRVMGGIDMLVVDYLQLMSGTGDNANERVSGITQALKGLALNLSIPVLLLSQLNRECEKRPNKRPIASDLRDSGSIEQDADVIWFIYRDEIYNPDSPDKGVAELICGKDRVSGNTGKTTPLAFIGHYGRFEELSGGVPSWAAPRTVEKKRHSGFKN